MSRNDTNLPRWVIFASGSLGSMLAEICTLPIDITKVRLQLQGEAMRGSISSGTVAQLQYRGMIHAGYSIVKEEGVGALYKGVRPALLRQCVYSGLRIGTYEPLRNRLTQGDVGPSPLWKKIIAGGLTGAFASAVATPTDLVKVRLQAEGRLPKGQTPRYKGVVHAFLTISRAEGVLGLWRGVIPTVQRAAVVNAAELASYDHCKQFLILRGIVDSDNTLAHFGASLMAGFIATVFSNPVDLIKTRIMNQQVIDGKPVYRGVIDCFVQTVRNEGPLALYKGFIPNYARLGPWCVAFFMSFEQFKRVLGSGITL